MNIGDNIKRLRLVQNLTQEELAEIVGVSKSAVSKWERGNTLPDIMILPALSSVFSVSIDEILIVEKELTIDEIQKKYKEYLEKFDKANDNEDKIWDVYLQINELKKQYHYSVELLFRFIILEISYLKNIKVEYKEEKLKKLKIELKSLKTRVNDTLLLSKIQYLELLVLYMLEEYQAVVKEFKVIDSDLIQYENLAIISNYFLGNRDSAIELLQIKMYQYVVQISNLIIIYYSAVEDIDKLEELDNMMDTILNTFYIRETFPFVELEFNNVKIIKSKELDEIIGLCRRNIELFKSEDMGFKSNEFYFGVDKWVKKLEFEGSLSRSKKDVFDDFIKIINKNEIYKLNDSDDRIKEINYMIKKVKI